MRIAEIFVSLFRFVFLSNIHLSLTTETAQLVIFPFHSLSFPSVQTVRKRSTVGKKRRRKENQLLSTGFGAQPYSSSRVLMGCASCSSFRTSSLLLPWIPSSRISFPAQLRIPVCLYFFNIVFKSLFYVPAVYFDY